MVIGFYLLRFRQHELRSLSAGNPLREFNLRLQAIREHHRRNPGEKAEPLKLDILVEKPLALGSLHTERLLEDLAVRRHEKATAKVAADAVLASTLPSKYAANITEGNISLTDFKVEAEAPSKVALFTSLTRQCLLLSQTRRDSESFWICMPHTPSISISRALW
jgi:hypothetical protein